MKTNTSTAVIQPNLSTAGNLWNNIVRTHPRFSEPIMVRKARLLAAFTFVIPIVGLFGLALLGITQPTILDDPDTLIMFSLLGVIAIAYFINRAGHYYTAAVLVVGSLLVGSNIAPFLPGSGQSVMPVTILPVLLAGIIYSPRISTYLSIATVVSLFGLIVISGSDRGYVDIAVIVTIIIVAIQLFMFQIRAIEQIRQKELEVANEALQESEKILEHRVEERTAELQTAKQELEVALEAALEADELKSQFLASMSHELRTPLNSILTFSDLMSMGTFGDVNEEQVDYLQKILFSGRHLLALINDVLDISKMSSGMMKLFVENDFDIVKEVDNAHATVEKMIGEKPVKLVVDVDSDLPHLTVDKRRVRQVLLNILSNAVKFTEEGTITLSGKKKQDEILFAIIDTGPGIPEGMHKQIFEPFVQTETGIKHAGGTGLGLPISKMLAEAHGGRLWLESTPGEGAAFFFSLPINPIVQPGEVSMQTH